MELFTLFDIIPVRMADILDILLVSILAYYVFYLFRGTRAVQMLFGGAILLIIWFIAKWWELHTLTWLLSNLATLGIIAVVILFQPEIRSALTRIGQMISRLNLRSLFFHAKALDQITEALSSAVQDLAKNRYGALIVLEKRVGLKNYADTGEYLHAKISARLLRSLFFPNSALHDGAVIVNYEEIVAAGCILPMPTSSDTESGYGMRHRAAKALAAECDAMVIVVSEETGIISIAYRNSLRRRLSIKELEEEIKRHWQDLFEDDLNLKFTKKLMRKES
ncbi:MAG: diadenylate cyclase CdaA [Fibrobacteraceae bacterium]|jgi:diadenylate cyclase|nr:diadenylate cyclase CdaA [Fibrobacteraceae bacterium]MEE1276369.1 diadenylate cyclase CdaA [Fibrobacteraceae bacterium]